MPRSTAGLLRAIAGGPARAWPAIVVVLVAMVAPGCMPFGLFQPPETLDAGEYAIGAGVSAVGSHYDPGDVNLFAVQPEVSGRLGLGDGYDVGAKVAWRPGAEARGMYADVRRQLPVTAVPVTASLGVSAELVETLGPPDQPDDGHNGLEGPTELRLAFFPGIAAGDEYLWFAARGIFLVPDRESPLEWAGMTLAVGNSAVELGPIRFLPELSASFRADDLAGPVLVACGLGIQYTGGARE